MANFRNFQKVTQALNYIASRYKNERTGRLMAMKLLWAADRYHVRKYGRFITEFDYYALPHGPVNSTALSIAKEEDFGEPYTPYAKRFLKKEGTLVVSINPVDNSKLSETDKEALEFALKSFGNMPPLTLRKLSHNYPEWMNHKEAEAYNTAIRMHPAEFFADPDPVLVPDDKFALPVDYLVESKEQFERSQTAAKVLQ